MTNERRTVNADSIRVEWDEDGAHMLISNAEDLAYDFRITDPEALYDHVKAAIGPWLYERDQARRSFEAAPDDSELAYDMSSTKHPRYHSTHADIWDAREGK